MATIVYILHLVGLSAGITTVVGVVIAYVNRADAPEWVQSHYQFQIHTFWIGMLYAFISVLTMLILVGWMLALFTVVWLIVRCAKGMKQIASGAAYPNVTTWLW
jgi:uncharacterized membrane protein